jgi:N-acetyl-anhydromuramyl-L-alanine amidase AmpD
MNKIIIHWTAGTYKPNHIDSQHYHYLIDDKGVIHYGKYRPEDNENCCDGRYAAHTGGGNTGAIGVALCSMHNFISTTNVGDYPITAKQLESCFELCAKLSMVYNIPVENIMTHYEFGKNHPDTSSHGKIDIIYLPPYPLVKRNEVGGFIRNKIRWYLNKLKGENYGRQQS